MRKNSVVNKHLAGYIARTREAKNMSLRKLADESGVSYSYISQLEKGRFNPDVEILKGLAKGLGVDVAEIMSLRSPLAALRDVTPEIFATDDGGEMVFKFQDATRMKLALEQWNTVLAAGMV